MAQRFIITTPEVRKQLEDLQKELTGAHRVTIDIPHEVIEPLPDRRTHDYKRTQK